MFDQRREEILARFSYRAPTTTQKALLAEAHSHVVGLAAFLVDNVSDGRDRELALTSLEDTRMKINKAIVMSEGA